MSPKRAFGKSFTESAPDARHARSGDQPAEVRAITFASELARTVPVVRDCGLQMVRAGVMGHSRVELGPEVYDKASLDEKRTALALVAKDLQANVQANQGGSD